MNSDADPTTHIPIYHVQTYFPVLMSACSAITLASVVYIYLCTQTRLSLVCLIKHYTIIPIYGTTIRNEYTYNYVFLALSEWMASEAQLFSLFLAILMYPFNFRAN